MNYEAVRRGLAQFKTYRRATWPEYWAIAIVGSDLMLVDYSQWKFTIFEPNTIIHNILDAIPQSDQLATDWLESTYNNQEGREDRWPKNLR
jgi:hypothetical protein